ncbi:MAG: hypothetical protein J1E57_00015 [Prevotella sp.]|nr:hypothetical protein [Prevotella sp.]
MAIHIDWQALPTPHEEKGKQPQLYPRLVDNEVVDFHKLCEKVSKHSSKSMGTVIGIVSDTIDVMKMLLHEGKTIDLEDFGVFKLSIGTDGYITPTTPYHNRKVVVRGVNFQPNKVLMDAIDTPDFRTVPRNASPVIMSVEQMQYALTDYFKTHDSITRSQVEKLCKMKRTTACERLSELVKLGFLRKVGYNKETKYEIIKYNKQ